MEARYVLHLIKHFCTQKVEMLFKIARKNNTKSVIFIIYVLITTNGVNSLEEQRKAFSPISTYEDFRKKNPTSSLLTYHVFGIE